MTRPLIYRLFAAALSLIVLVSVTGCGKDTPEDARITGQIALAPADARLGPDATARVSLIQHGDTPGSDHIVAERTLHDLGRLPISFRLVIGHALLDSGDEYGVGAQIMDGDGDVVWQTEAPQAVSVFDAKPLHLTLQAAGVSPDGPFARFRCDDGFTFQLARDARGALVRLGKRQINLRIAEGLSPRSVRYVDSHNDEIVMGNGVTSIYFDGVSHHDCEPVTTGAGPDAGD